MEVILRENIASLGKVGQVIKVKDGYARNYLLPQRLAYQASEANRKHFETERKKLEAQQAEKRSVAVALSEKIQALTLTINKQAGEEDKLYGSVNAGDIAAALHEAGVEVDRRMITFANVIKTLGEHHVEIHLYSDVVARLSVHVVRE